MKLFKQFIKFTATGMSCFAIDFSIMVFLTEVCGIRYLLSSGISFTIATAVNYLISVNWVYSVRDKRIKKIEFIIFISLSAIGLGLNQALMWLMVEKLNIYYMASKVVSGATVGFYNFTTRKIYLER